MTKELEIEFKNMLTKEEYSKLLAEQKTAPISQTNHYFDTAGGRGRAFARRFVQRCPAATFWH